jgi:hypothetical protein
MYSKVSSDWLLSYIKATRPILEIFKMAGYFMDSPRIGNWVGFRAGLDVGEKTALLLPRFEPRTVEPVI